MCAVKLILDMLLSVDEAVANMTSGSSSDPSNLGFAVTQIRIKNLWD